MEQGAWSRKWRPYPSCLPTKPTNELKKLLENPDPNRLLEEIKAIRTIQSHLGHGCLVQEFFHFFHTKWALEKKEVWMTGLQLLLVAAVTVEMPSTVPRQKRGKDQELWNDIDSWLLIVHLAHQMFGISKSCLLRHNKLPTPAWKSLPMKILWFVGSGLRADEKCPTKYSVIHPKTGTSKNTMMANEFQALPVNLDLLKDTIKLRFLSAEITSLGIFLAVDPPMKMNSFILIKERSLTTVASPASSFFLQPMEYNSYQRNAYLCDVRVGQDDDFEGNFQTGSLLQGVTSKKQSFTLVNETLLLHRNYATQLAEQVMDLAFLLLKCKSHEEELTKIRPVSKLEVKGGLTFLESMQNSASKICVDKLLQSLKKISDDAKVIHASAKQACHDLYKCLISLHCNFIDFRSMTDSKKPQSPSLSNLQPLYKNCQYFRESKTTDPNRYDEMILRTLSYSSAAGKHSISEMQQKTVAKSLPLGDCGSVGALNSVIDFSSALSAEVMDSVISHLLCSCKNKNGTLSDGTLSNQPFHGREDIRKSQKSWDVFKLNTEGKGAHNRRISLKLYCEYVSKIIMNSALVETILDNNFPSVVFYLQDTIDELNTLDSDLWQHLFSKHRHFLVRQDTCM